MKHSTSPQKRRSLACLVLIATAGLTACVATGPSAVSGDSAPAVNIAQGDVTTAALAGVADHPPEYWEEIICRREPVTGTRLTRGRCHSRYDWTRMSGAAKETMRDIWANPIPEACGEPGSCAE